MAPDGLTDGHGQTYIPPPAAGDNKLSCQPDLGSSFSKLMMLLVNVLLKFQTLISQIHQYFLLKNCEKILHCKSFSHFQQKISVYFVIKL